MNASVSRPATMEAPFPEPVSCSGLVPAVFLFVHPRHELWARPVLPRLPVLTGPPVRIEDRPGLRDRHGPVHAGAFLRERRIALNCAQREFARVFVHEVFHFVWLRLGNPRRQSYKDLVRLELAAGARGELGWSAEWRKSALPEQGGLSARTRCWHDYCCESFCDSAAWLYSGVKRHEEFTLGRRFQHLRQAWFLHATAAGPLSI